ncbi:monovalent cation/H(+) antiporter subunit G [Pseudomonas saliphila]|uniref:monovalent cation/H(+) antiporter subunit G n=1 Tax=Pseudomonas saliphila TaxID=2586906 RepID=UPI0012394789|nr:monovalent cation/H(+) antiporter subunit G [Pseudomonas saliphila]
MSVVNIDLPLWLAVPFVLLLLLGSLIILIGALGLLRLPSFYQRIHGPAITITLGTGCVLFASMLYFSNLESRLVLHELLIAAFLLLTAPVTSMMIMRASVYRDLRAGRIIRESDAKESYRFPGQHDE